MEHRTLGLVDEERQSSVFSHRVSPVPQRTAGARPPRCRLIVIIALLLTSGVALSACTTPADSTATSPFLDKGVPYTDLLVPRLQASVSDGEVGVAVDSAVTVTAGDGVLGAVNMVNSDGEVVAGELGSDGLTWSTAEPLGYNKRYTLTAEALGLSGAVDTRMSFQTQSPQNLTMPYVTPAHGAVVGVGQPVSIRFDENIADRATAQQAIDITTTPPVEGAFYWLSAREVRWRPAQYWQPGTTVEVNVDTYGVDLGDGLFGQDDASTRFTIGDRVIATADDDTKTLTVRRNGEVVKTMPLSMGKDRTPTDNGAYIVGDRYADLIMDSSTYGVPVNSPDGYRLEVDWATQMSYSGIYVHSAPWSVDSQGITNVSAGCLNVSPGNAKWFYDNTTRGDIVEVVNTVGPTLSGVDGLGDWNVPWDQWRTGNADV